MTFFSSPPPTLDTPARSSPIAEIPGYGESIGIYRRIENLRTNSNGISGNYTKDEEEAVVSAITGKIGDQEVLRVLKDKGIAPPMLEVFRPEIIRQNPKAKQALMDHARTLAEENPNGWADIDLSDEGIDARTNDRLRAEFDELQSIADMVPEEYLGEGFLGAGASALTDIRQAPFMFLGLGGKSIFAVAGREALINGSLEAALMPSQFQMSERLDTADPNVARQIALAATFGAAFGGGMAALGRGINYYRLRQSAPENLDLTDVNRADVEALIDRAEEAILRSEELPDMDIPLRERDRIPSEDPLPPAPTRAPRSEPDTIEEALRREVDEASIGVVDKPVSKYIKNPRLVEYIDGGGTRTMQVHPEGRAAQTLRAMGITSRTLPGLFNRNGRKDFDNLVASEFEDLFPGIRQQVGDDGRYLDQDGFLRLLAEELHGSPSPLAANQRLAEAELRLDEYQRSRELLSRQIEPIPDDIDITSSQGRMAEIYSHIDEGLRANGLSDVITASQRADMASWMADRGGSVDDFLDAMDEADLSFAESRIGEPDGRPFAPRDESELSEGASGPGRQQQDASPAQGGRGSGEAAASADGSRADFDDPTEATDTQRIIMSDIRDDIEALGNFDVEFEIDGVTLRTAQDVMDYLDQGEAFSARIDLCGLGGRT